MPDNAIVLWVDGTSGSPELERHLAHLMAEYFELWKTKQLKYGASNIASLGMPGLYARSNDKMQRIKRFVFGVEPTRASWLTRLGVLKADAEGSQEDAHLDLAGYNLMAVMVLRAQWPTAPEDKVTFKQIWNLLRFWIGWKK